MYPGAITSKATLTSGDKITRNVIERAVTKAALDPTTGASSA